MSKILKAVNKEMMLKELDKRGIEYTVINLHSEHYKLMDFNFWPTTGKFHNQKTGKVGRGVHNLIKLL